MLTSSFLQNSIHKLFTKLYALDPQTDDFSDIERDIKALEKQRIKWPQLQSLFGHNLAHVCALRGLKNILEALILRSGQLQDPLDITALHAEEGFTPLHLACGRGFPEVVKLILECAPQIVNVQDPLGMTALHIAYARLWNDEVKTQLIALLLSHFASWGIPNVVGILPHEMKSRGVFGEDRLNCFHQTPAHYVNFEVMRRKLGMRSDLMARLVNQGDDSRRTPLMYMVMSQSLPGIDFLLARGAEVDKRDDKKRSALFYAVALGTKKEVVLKLLQAGASSLLSDSSGMTPMMIAQSQGRDELVSLFQQYLSPPSSALIFTPLASLERPATSPSILDALLSSFGALSLASSFTPRKK